MSSTGVRNPSPREGNRAPTSGSHGGRTTEDSAPLLPSTTTRTSSTGQRAKQSDAPTPFVVDLWDGVMADAQREAGAARPLRSDGGATPLCQPPAPANAAAANFAVAAEAPPAPKVMTATVFYRKRKCTMTLDKTADKLRIMRRSSAPGQKDKVVLYVPMHAVLNIETPEERDQRQRMHVANDHTTTMNLNDGKHPTDRFLSSFPEVAPGAETYVYGHLRTDTFASSVTGTTTNHFDLSTASRPVSAGAAGVPGGLAPPCKYFLHYTRVEKMGSRKSIHSMELTVADVAPQPEAAYAMAKAILRRVYLRGPKKLIAFVSPKSGTGQGVDVFKSQVRPFIHFSRHSLHTIVTRRAHDAEDYVADLDHYMDGGHVLVAVGGDGMMHEVVNGLHRRKLQLATLIRQECRRRVASDERAAAPARPPPAHGDSQGNAANKKHADDDDGGTNEEGERDAADTAQKHKVLTVQNMKIPPTAPATPPAVNVPNSGRPAARAPVLSPSAHSRTVSMGGVSGTYDTYSPGFLHLVTNSQSLPLTPQMQPQRPADNAFGEWITNLFLMHGWEGLLPATATIPTGSACGLAKSLDVLSTTQSAISLVHLAEVPEDLLYMRFAPNPDLLAYHRDKWKGKKLRNAEEKFKKYQAQTRDELAQRELAGSSLAGPGSQGEPSSPAGVTHSPYEAETRPRHASTGAAAAAAAAGGGGGGVALEGGKAEMPFLRDGSAIYQDPVSMVIGAPEMSSRIAFMSLSFGIANDIDRGSEGLRWMGNARFSVYGGYVILRGITPYQTTIRYLPWVSKEGRRLEKVHKTDLLPDASQLPRCTMRADCPHCLDYPPPDPLRAATRARREGKRANDGDGRRQQQQRQDAQRSLREFFLPHTDVIDPAVVAEAPEADLFGEETVDFDDDTLPWVTLSGDVYSLLICNLRDVAQDMMMAPFAHMSDGAMDLVFSRVSRETGGGGRKEFLKFFAGLESGEHVNHWFSNYVKARAVEVKVDGGISMADGEMMPLSSVRLTKLRSGNRMVRLD